MSSIPIDSPFSTGLPLLSLLHGTSTELAKVQAEKEKAARDMERAVLASIKRGNLLQTIDLDEVVSRDATISGQYALPDRGVAALITHAQWTLTQLVRKAEVKPTKEAEAALSSTVRFFARSGGPTPQVGLSNDGALDVEWIVGDYLVALDVADDGTCSIHGEGPGGTELFDFEFHSFGKIPPDAVAAVREVLATMGRAVRFPAGA